MLLLTKSPLDSALFNISFIDSPGNSASRRSLYHNVLEAATILESFEDAYSAILPSFNAYGYDIIDVEDFTQVMKPLYQALRHGLSFDWVVNRVIGNIKRTFPFCHLKEFKGTQPFIDQHSADIVFQAELTSLDILYSETVKGLFTESDAGVFERLVRDSKQTDFMDCVRWARDTGATSKYVITEDTMYKTNYLVALGMMLEQGVGLIKRTTWHKTIEAITAGEPEYKDCVVVCGGKFNAFAYGNLGDGNVKWHKFEQGIKYDLMSSPPVDANRVLPDHCTFVKFGVNTIQIDESFYPEISISGGPWINHAQFAKLELQLDEPIKYQLRYRFANIAEEDKTVVVQAVNNCVVKDMQLKLDEEGVASSQLVFRADSIAFSVNAFSRRLPAITFVNTKTKKSNIAWS